MKRSPTVKLCTLVSMAVFVLVSLNGCFTSRKEIHYLKKKTFEIQEGLYRLRKDIEERLRFLERPDGKYDYNNSLLIDRHRLDRVLSSIVTIETQTLFEASETSERVVKN